MIEIKSEIISRKCIKPSSPTPDHLKTFKLSLLDQLSPAIHGNMTFFYTSNNFSDFSTKSQLLQVSLSKTLTLFYPLAGRLQGTATVDCNDEGVFFVEAKINIELSEFLKQPDFNAIDHFLPTNDPEIMELSNVVTLIVQFTGFACGGTAISLSLTHKLADISALLTLLQSWTTASRGFGEPVIPEYIGATLLPPKDDLPNISASINISSEKFALRRFVFSAEKIAELKAKVDHEFEQVMQCHPSRVEVVLALIWKCAISAKRSINLGSFKPSALFQAVNFRKRMSPPLPETAAGNFVWPFIVLVQEDKDLVLHKLAIEMRKAFKDFCNNKAEKFKGEEGSSAIFDALQERREFFKNNRDMTIYKCSSWCKFSLYETDFGWGIPMWNVSVNKLVSNTIALADTRLREGIEALVTLDDEEMAIFERDVDLLDYATLNPSACD